MLCRTPPNQPTSDILLYHLFNNIIQHTKLKSYSRTLFNWLHSLKSTHSAECCSIFPLCSRERGFMISGQLNEKESPRWRIHTGESMRFVFCLWVVVCCTFCFVDCLLLCIICVITMLSSVSPSSKRTLCRLPHWCYQYKYKRLDKIIVRCLLFNPWIDVFQKISV